ncbi:PPE family protein [Mycobacterium sp. HUMS_1102779]|uniref:PPE family protein n=1 Tax=Mycobacterium sp. HUMS_1102779 TaxID=3383487 RepID=UPI00389A8FF6
MDFGAIPPEINSARMYSGPGSSSLMAAASAWNGLAAELNSTALGYDKVVTALSSEEWLGPASASMAQAVQPYVAWMSTTAAQAEQAAAQARAAAAAYESALAATVPPPLVAANRTETAQAIATNVLGQNTGIIAQLEAQYAQMWAQDATAMYTYAAQSSTASKVTPYKNAPAIANPAAQSLQTAATTTAAGGSATNNLQNLISSLPSQLQSLASPSGLANQLGSNNALTELWFLISGQSVLPSNIGTFVQGYNNYSALWYNTEGLPYFSVGMGNFGVQIAKTTGALGGVAPAAAGAAKALPGLGGLGGLLGGGGGVAAHAASATASMGNAASIGGKLAVPVSWSGATAPLAHTPAQLVSTVSAAPEAAAGAGGPGNLLGGMPLAGAGAGSGVGSGPRYGFRPVVMARPPFAG